MSGVECPAWCDEHDHDAYPHPGTCGTRNPDLVIDLGPGPAVWPTFDPETQETRIQIGAAPSGRELTLHEAVKLSDALRRVRAALLGREDGKGDDPQTRAVTEAYRLGYAAGQETAGLTCTERGQTGRPLRQREVSDEEGVDMRTVWDCVDAAGCFGRLREQHL